MPLYVTAVGDFGRAVADRLSVDHDLQLAAPTEIADSSRWPTASVHVVAAWRETPALFELADRQAFILRRPWLSVTLDATSLRVGPLVLGDAGPCYRCFLARQFQHRRLRELDRRLFAWYHADPACGVSGYLEPHVELGAVAVGFAVDAVSGGCPAAERGRLRRFGLLDPQVSIDTVLPVHGCARCGRVDPAATWTRLAHDVGSLLPATADPAFPGRSGQVPACVYTGGPR